jgi:predicted DCC family thiol-disulfide oxidoreductase YuxK
LGEVDGAPLDDLRLLLRTGELIRGADAYRHAMRRIWWAYPIFAVSTWPVLRSLFDASYRWFAKHRHQVSEACGLPGSPEGRPESGPPTGDLPEGPIFHP